jgi:hypothetical protein
MPCCIMRTQWSGHDSWRALEGSHTAVTGCIVQVNAKRIVPEWTHYDDTVRAFEERVMAKAA